MGGWVGGEMEIKANLSLRLVEVEAELGKNVNCNHIIKPDLILLTTRTSNGTRRRIVWQKPAEGGAGRDFLSVYLMYTP